jgi:succinoglycan biosynthesis protein ExoO
MPPGTCLVTVVIPVFNSAPTLRRAAASALRQDVQPLEVLIVDDGSNDGSLEEASRIAADDDRVRIIALPENRGKPHAMNRAIDVARGTWIAVLDADDFFADHRLATLIAAAERNGVDLVADNQCFVDAGAGQIVRTAFPAGRGEGPLTRRDFIAGSDPFAAFNFGMLKPVVHAGFIRRTGLRYRESARLSEDFLYITEFFAAGGRAWLIALPLYCWTQAFGTLSRRWTSTGAGAWRYDFLAARAANAEVRDSLSTSADTDLVALLDRRDRALWRLHWLREISRRRDAGRGLPALLGAVARHPAIWPFILWHAARTAWRRIPGRRTARARVDAAAT